MRGKAIKRRVCRVFCDNKGVWFREYYNPRTDKKETLQSPCQNGIKRKEQA